MSRSPLEPGQLRFPLLPLRDIVVFPHMVVPLFVGRDRSIRALEEAMTQDKNLVLAAQKSAKVNEPSNEDIFSIGTIGHIIQLIRHPDGTVKVLVEGKARVHLDRVNLTDDGSYFEAVIRGLAEEDDVPSLEIEALVRSVQQTFEQYCKLNKRVPQEMVLSVQTLEMPGRLTDTIAGALSLKLSEKQELLETASAKVRMHRLLELMQAEIEIFQVEKKIRTRVKKQMEKTQKEYYLNEQMQAIQKELGERDEFKNEVQELEEKIKNKKMSKEARSRLEKELRKMKLMSPMSAEATVVRNYIDWVLALPWEEKTEDQVDIKEAAKVLDEDHYGLEKIKERIVEYLAVQALVKKSNGPILCLVGPPGVGKTSLARSVARAMGRKFVRISLGGVRDEAEIRGHRRTYIGAMPGKIIQSLKKAGSNNPVFLLDEIDKMSTDFRGDPSSALLEVLDPEQNSTFNDHYVDLDYDLSDVLFITTANSLYSIPMPLQDRMEIIELGGYTEWEKVAIADKYLIPKGKKNNGIENIETEFAEESLRTVIQHYTKEAGVRNLEREIATILRKVAKEVIDGKRTESVRITRQNLQKYLGKQKFRSNRAEERDEVGLCNGLAVTMFGGDILPAEVSIVPGKGKLVLTGKLGNVMQESAQAAMSYIRSRVDWLGLEREFYSKVDIHIHFPEGAIPKDGPSAGVTMATALTSALLRVPVRRDVAMTGEITLRGRVLPIGGLKDKVLAAHRAEIFTVIFPKENEKDIDDIPKRVLKAMKLIPVEHMDEVLRLALRPEKQDEFLHQPSRPLDWRTGEPPAAEPASDPVATAIPLQPSTH